MSRTIAVVGGGLAGLLCGVEAKRRGLDVTVYEASPLPGGIARTIIRAGYHLEPAVGTLRLPDPNLSPILDAAGAAVSPATVGSVRYLYTDGALHRLAPGPQVLATDALSRKAKARLVVEPLIQGGGDDRETLAGFARRRFGREAGTVIADLMAAGVFAGDAEELAAVAAFPRLVELERRWGSVLWGAYRSRRVGPRPMLHVPDGGTTGLVDALASYLGAGLATDTAVSSVTPVGSSWKLAGPEVEVDEVVVAVPPATAAGLIGANPLTDKLAQPSPAAPVAVVWMSLPNLELPEGFGYVTTASAGGIVLGCLFESSYAPARSPEGTAFVKVICGGGRRPEAVDWTDERLVTTVADEVGVALNQTIEPSFSHVARHVPGIPQYGPGHQAWLSTLDSLRGNMPGLHLAGWWYRGVGMSTLAAGAVAIADEVSGR